MIEYDMVWYDMIWCDIIWYDIVWCDMVWYDMIEYDMIWYDIVWCDVYSIVSYDACSIVLGLKGKRMTDIEKWWALEILKVGVRIVTRKTYRWTEIKWEKKRRKKHIKWKEVRNVRRKIMIWLWLGFESF